MIRAFPANAVSEQLFPLDSLFSLLYYEPEFFNEVSKRIDYRSKEKRTSSLIVLEETLRVICSLERTRKYPPKKATRAKPCSLSE